MVFPSVFQFFCFFGLLFLFVLCFARVFYGFLAWFCFSGDFLFWALLRYLLENIFLFFLGFLSKF